VYRLKKEYLIVLGVFIILLLVVGVLLLSSQKRGELIIIGKNSTTSKGWIYTTYTLQWRGSTTVLHINEGGVKYNKTVNDGSTFLVQAQSYYYVTITWTGGEITLYP
jgi:hypothetical protein